mmetsp:Transcript_13549/g.45812  ORF Transcript_13549/g.45812 Transcript_13549/m.45812 type:complete len:200 (+) Transcript_13549:994-1593(+)
MPAMGMSMAAAEGKAMGSAAMNWKIATHPLRYTTSTSQSPRAFSLYTEENTMGTQLSTSTRDHVACEPTTPSSSSCGCCWGLAPKDGSSTATMPDTTTAAPQYCEGVYLAPRKMREMSMEMGMADCCSNTIMDALVMKFTEKVCMTPAMESSAPMTANLYLGMLVCSLVMRDVQYMTGNMYMNDAGMYTNVLSRLLKNG